MYVSIYLCMYACMSASSRRNLSLSAFNSRSLVSFHENYSNVSFPLLRCCNVGRCVVGERCVAVYDEGSSAAQLKEDCAPVVDCLICVENCRRNIDIEIHVQQSQSASVCCREIVYESAESNECIVDILDTSCSSRARVRSIRSES